MEVARYPSTLRNYTDEFRAQAVALAESVGRTEAARQLEMPVKTLDNWEGAMHRGRPLSSPDRNQSSAFVLTFDTTICHAHILTMIGKNGTKRSLTDVILLV
ncbi:transposase [Pseudomonas urmiensis]|uniref:Transposase n=1 Tax=Pseudomonas urmiensis TaxID=2745493 RepID=A0ABW8NYP7_9PSED